MDVSPASTEIDEIFYDGYSGRSGFQTAQQSDMNGQSEEANIAHVTSMCRCPSGQAPFPFYRDIAGNAGHGGLKFDGPGYDTGLIQPRSLATGPPRAFVHHHLSACTCAKDENIAGHTQDQFLKNISPHNFRSRCPHLDPDVMDRWKQMPDWGVQDLPIFVGIQSFETPLSLDASLSNSLEHNFFARIKAKGVFVQLNHRSDMDDEVVAKHQLVATQQGTPLTVTGSAEENLNPGLAISKMCRMAEQHPDGHPNGENVLMFLEKDWQLRVWHLVEEELGIHGRHYNPSREGQDFYMQGQSEKNKYTYSLEDFFQSAVALLQRGVDIVRLKNRFRGPDGAAAWPCQAQGMRWTCITSHQMRWANQPVMFRCDWFLRYLEPFAIQSLTDPILTGCRRGFPETGYCDWEEAMQDGRIAWTNSNWVIASKSADVPLDWSHREVDG